MVFFLFSSSSPREKEIPWGVEGQAGENDEVKILSGPLKDMVGMVRKINMHKRIAEVEVVFMGRKIVLHLGIEIVEKKW